MPASYDVSTPKFSVIVPTLNEAARLETTLRSLRSNAAGHAVQIVVVDGGSSDATLEIARAAADVVLQTAPGRGAQMHQGALAATGDVLLFLHADTQLPSNWPAVLTAAYRRSPAPVATAFRLRFDNDSWIYRVLEFGAHLRNLATGIAHGDQALSVNRGVYLNAGGFPSVPLMEEYFLGRALRTHGRTWILNATVMTSARRYEENGPLRNVFRNQILIFLLYLGVPVERLARFYQRTRKTGVRRFPSKNHRDIGL
jgi:rSAM/selenodomain-associated transferase 2